MLEPEVERAFQEVAAYRCWTLEVQEVTLPPYIQGAAAAGGPVFPQGSGGAAGQGGSPSLCPW